MNVIQFEKSLFRLKFNSYIYKTYTVNKLSEITKLFFIKFYQITTDKNITALNLTIIYTYEAFFTYQVLK